MDLADKTAIALAGIGLGSGAVYMVGPKYIPHRVVPFFGLGGLFLVVACVAYLIYVHGYWNRSVTPALMMIVGGTVFMTGAILYIFGWHADSDITWRFGESDQFFLGLGGDPITVTSFQASAHNNLRRPLSRISGFIRIEANNLRFPITFGRRQRGQAGRNAWDSGTG